MKKEETDPYEKAFSDCTDAADKIGEKIGSLINRSGWKLFTILVVGIAIFGFGIVQFFWGFGKGLKKRKK